MKKYIAIILVLTFSILFFFQIEMVRNFAKKTLPNSIKTDIKEFIFGKERWEEFKKLKKYGDMNYNKKLLPKTQFTIINFREIPLVGLNLEGISHYNKLFRNRSSIKFFLEKFYDGILLVDAKGKIFFIENSSFQYSDQFKWNKIDSNLTSNNIYEVLDTLTIDDEIYISFSEAKSEKCKTLNIVKAKYSKKILKFNSFFKSKSCANHLVGGRMVFYETENNGMGLLISTGAVSEEKNLAQDEKSIFGKILFINLETKESIIFSSGHRNPQGLMVENNSIIATEHGPRGGDEINLIIQGKNYGWPLASYGEPYSSQNKDIQEYKYLKNHADHGFNEPIYSFVPSIGISEIIKVPDNFSEYWKNNFLVTSLGATNIYRILFDKDFSKVIYYEKIFIGKRIRDILYLEKFKAFLIALETQDGGSIGVLINNYN